MATKKPAPAAEAPAAPAAGGGSKKRIIIIVLLGVLLVAISVGGTVAALKFFGNKEKPEAGKGTHEASAKEGKSEEKAPSEKPQKPIYLELKPEITVSFDVNGRQRFLKITVNALTRDHDVETAFNLHSPAVSNAMVMIISNKKFDEMQTTEGKETLRKQCLEEMNKIIEKETGKKDAVEQVLFSEFIMQ